MNRTKKKANQQKKNNNSKIFKFFNSPIPIIIVLILFSIFLLFYNNYLKNSYAIYNFGGSKDDFTFYNGMIYIGKDYHYFNDSKVRYSGKDIEIYDFTIGYFIKENNEYLKISSSESLSDMKENGVKLTYLLENTDFTFTETHKEAKYFNQSNIKNIKNLVFRINGVDKKGKEINIEIPLEVNKITK